MTSLAEAAIGVGCAVRQRLVQADGLDLLQGQELLCPVDASVAQARLQHHKQLGAFWVRRDRCGAPLSRRRAAPGRRAPRAGWRLGRWYRPQGQAKWHISLHTSRLGNLQALSEAQSVGEVTHASQAEQNGLHAGLAVALAIEKAAESGDEPDEGIERGRGREVLDLTVARQAPLDRRAYGAPSSRSARTSS